MRGEVKVGSKGTIQAEGCQQIKTASRSNDKYKYAESERLKGELSFGFIAVVLYGGVGLMPGLPGTVTGAC